MAYCNSNIDYEITSDLCDWWTFMTSTVFLEGQIWLFHLQFEVVTNIHQTDTLLTHKCRKAITRLDLENIKTRHIVTYRVLIWSDPYCWSLPLQQLIAWTIAKPVAAHMAGSDGKCVSDTMRSQYLSMYLYSFSLPLQQFSWRPSHMCMSTRFKILQSLSLWAPFIPQKLFEKWKCLKLKQISH